MRASMGRALPIVLICVVLVGCGGGEEGSESGSRAVSRTSVEDELVELHLRRVDRGDLAARGVPIEQESSIAALEAGLRTNVDAMAEAVPTDEDASAEKMRERLVAWTRAVLEDPERPGLLPSGFAGLLAAPGSALEVFRDDGVVVRRYVATEPAPSGDLSRELLVRRVEGWRARFDGATMAIAIKTVGFESLEGDRPSIRARLAIELRGSSAQGSALRELHMTWGGTWALSISDGETSLRPTELRVERIEDVERSSEPGGARTLFVDATATAFRRVPGYSEQHGRGIESWASRITRLGDMHLSGHHGLAVGDVNGDGREDLFVCDGGSLPNRLYLQQPDGSVIDASRSANLDWLEDSRSALLVDLDNDGDQDLVVATIATVVFAENDGVGVFKVRGGHMDAKYPFSLSAADFDLDGDLDLHVCVYSGAGSEAAGGARGFEGRSPVPFEDATNGGRNVLLENLGDWRFANASERCGLDDFPRRWSFAAAWEDYDRDGDPDLYVANDFGKNQLFRNDLTAGGKRRFVDVAGKLGVEDTGAGMSVSWGDANRDGQADLHVGNMFSAAGALISRRSSFVRGKSNEKIERLRRMAKGNSLFLGAPGGRRFEDVGEYAGVELGRWAWSSGFVDIDGDGWDDLVVSNGFLTSTRADDL